MIRDALRVAAIGIISFTLASVVLLSTARADPFDDLIEEHHIIDDIQIVRSESKPINYIIKHRYITSIQYTVDFKGFYIECVSVVMNTTDGRMVSHMYNRCTEHLKED